MLDPDNIYKDCVNYLKDNNIKSVDLKNIFTKKFYILEKNNNLKIINPFSEYIKPIFDPSSIYLQDFYSDDYDEFIYFNDIKIICLDRDKINLYLTFE